jgi:hypothetical protein
MSRVTHEATAIEWMKKAPLTQAVVPQMRLDCTVYRLRKKGWPVICEMRVYFDENGHSELRAEFRLGNWTARAFPVQTAAVTVVTQSETR